MPSPLSKKCAQGHENPLTAATCPECGYTFEGSGIKCVKCGNLINPGETKCASCGADILTRTEVTPKDIGIELKDGRFHIIVPRYTPYPTESPLHELYSTPQANVVQLRIEVYEGESNIAKENEWLGTLVLELPEGLPENTPIDISFDLDGDGSIFVSAKLVAQPLTAVSARIERISAGARVPRETKDLLRKARVITELVGKDRQKQLQVSGDEIGEAVRKRDPGLINRQPADRKKGLSPKRRKAAPEVELSRCAACGRPMGQSARKGEKWCAACLDIMARFLTASLYQVNKLGEGETALSHLLEQTKSPIWQYYLGLVQAQAGKLDSAIELLKSLLGSNDEHPGLHGTLASLLTTRASQGIKDRDYQSSVQDLSLAAELEPRNQAIAQSLSLARGIEAFLQIDAEAGGEALAKLIQTWHKMQLRQPDNYSIVHNLAILSYRLASEAEEEAREKIADNAWRDTVANWSLLLNADAFWEQLIERESSLYQLNASVDDISHLRLGLRERLLEDFRAYRIRYGEANNPNASRRHREYEVLFLLEIKTAEAMRKVLDLLHQKDLASSISLPCGPIMLQSLGLFPSAQEMVTQARNHRLPIDEVNKLENCLSPAGRVEVLVETHWLEQAEAELDELLEKAPTKPELLSYMVRVLKEQGTQLAAVGKFEEAMKKLEKGLHYATDDRDLEDAMVMACLDEAKRLSEGNKKADIEKAMKILTRGRKLVPKSSQLKENLATYYVRRGIIEGNNDKWEAAWKDLIRALGLDRNNGLALRNLEIVANNHSVALANAGSRSEAIEVVTKSLNYLDSPRLRDLLRRIRGW